jgi:HD-like signal output (HDOD) protein
MGESLHDLLDRIQEVCPLPQSAQRVIELSGDPNVRLDQVTEAIAVDPALAAEVLRISNSAAYGRTRAISDLGQAVMTIGLHELHQMATAMAMLAAFQTESELARKIHDQAVLSGSIARLLAKELTTDASAAFLCGLLCEIGAMACLAVDTDGYIALWNRVVAGEARRPLETERYGATTRHVGARLLDRNQLPEPLHHAVGMEDDDVANAETLPRVTAFARRSAQYLVDVGTGATGPAQITEGLAEIGADCGVPLAGDRLFRVCVQAGGVAQRALRQSR